MKETFKSLSIFSAMLMLLLMISTGCDVNIPGCGKRSLPFFKQINNNVPVTTQPVAVTNNNPAPVAASAPAILKSTAPTIVPTKSVAVVGTTASPTPVPVDVEKFAYTTIENGQPTLWTMNTNGTERTRLTPIGTSSWHPIWSPNGKTLAFLSNANDGKVNLYAVQKGSTTLIQLTSWDDMEKPDTSSLQAPFTWSPKSDQIAYAYKNQIWVVELDSLEQSTLVTADPDYVIASLQWAPHRENKFIAYSVRKGDNYYGVMVVNPRLKDKLTLVESIRSVPVISWASDATKVAYLSDSKQIASTTLEDSTPKDLFVGIAPILGPELSYTPVDANYRLMVLAKKTPAETGYRVAILEPGAKGAKDVPALKYLTESGIESAVWSPDGNKIAYVTAGELWVMDSASGNNKTRIALTGILSPDWSKK